MWGERMRFQLSSNPPEHGTLVQWRDVLSLGNSGNVGIGTLDCPSYRLAVEGKIGCRELKVTNTAWCDYIFDKDYKLLPLADLENYIKKITIFPGYPLRPKLRKMVELMWVTCRHAYLKRWKN